MRFTSGGNTKIKIYFCFSSNFLGKQTEIKGRKKKTHIHNERVLECDIYIYGDIRRENTETLLFFFSFLEEGRRVSHFFLCICRSPYGWVTGYRRLTLCHVCKLGICLIFTGAWSTRSNWERAVVAFWWIRGIIRGHLRKLVFEFGWSVRKKFSVLGN